MSEALLTGRWTDVASRAMLAVHRQGLAQDKKIVA
jgi:hypothetical protein